MAETKVRSSQISGVTDPLQDQLDEKITLSGFIRGELPSGTINGVNVTFTLTNTPNTDTEEVTLDGVEQERTTDYSVSGDTITFIVAPTGGSVIVVDYVFGVTTSSSTAFQWSTSEQIWPYEVTDAGETIFCKQFNIASFPNNGNVDTAHGVAGLIETDAYEMKVIAADTAAAAQWNFSTNRFYFLTGTVIRLTTTFDDSASSGKIQFFYIKP